MLRAMSELENAVNELLGRCGQREGSPSGFEKRSGLPGDEEPRAREREAAEWVRRALERLKAL